MHRNGVDTFDAPLHAERNKRAVRSKRCRVASFAAGVFWGPPCLVISKADDDGPPANICTLPCGNHTDLSEGNGQRIMGVAVGTVRSSPSETEQR